MENEKLPTFETKRLFLRGVQLSDSESYQKNFADYEVIRHLSHQVPWPYPENGVYEFLKNLIMPIQGVDRWTWAIFLKENKDEVIGIVDLWRKGCPENRGFWLAKKFWHNGYMTEAVQPVMDYAFTDLGFERLVFANAVGNTRSRRVKEKTKAKFIEVRPAKFVDPAYSEHEIWELTKEAWLAPIDRTMKVIEDYEVCYPNPLNLNVGDKIQLVKKEVPEKWRGWNWCKDSHGNCGWISESYFKRTNAPFAEIVKNYTAKEISVNTGNEVEPIFDDCGWTWCKNSNGDEGWLPTEVLEPLN